MRFLFLLILLCLQACTCGSSSRPGVLKIGIDSTWSPLNFGAQQPYVNGFTEELLLEMARYSGVEFERIPANWDALLDGMKQGNYDAVLTSLPTYDSNQAHYDFSESFLDLGPVLIVPVGAKQTDLQELKGELVGLVAGDPGIVLIREVPGAVVRTFESVPALLNSVVAGEIQAAILPRIPAVNYIRDLYAGQLQIVGAPLSSAGLRLATLKDQRGHLVQAFDKSLEQLKKKKRLEALQKKWSLE